MDVEVRIRPAVEEPLEALVSQGGSVLGSHLPKYNALPTTTEPGTT